MNNSCYLFCCEIKWYYFLHLVNFYFFSTLELSSKTDWVLLSGVFLSGFWFLVPYCFLVYLVYSSWLFFGGVVGVLSWVLVGVFLGIPCVFLCSLYSGHLFLIYLFVIKKKFFPNWNVYFYFERKIRLYDNGVCSSLYNSL